MTEPLHFLVGLLLGGLPLSGWEEGEMPVRQRIDGYQADRNTGEKNIDTAIAPVYIHALRESGGMVQSLHVEARTAFLSFR